MILPELGFGDAGLILLTIVVLWVPGTAALLASGSRGWVPVAVGPLGTYGIAGVAGPATSGIGAEWGTVSLLAATLVAALLGFGVRRLTRRWADGGSTAPACWPLPQSLAVAGATTLAALIGGLAVLVGFKRLSTLPQDWDAAFHANGIAWIANTGDGGLTGMSRIVWFGSAPPQYYPNSYHLVSAVITDLTGRDIPSVLNANTALIPGILALGIAVLCRRLGSPALLAVAAVLVVVGVSSFYDMLWRGPLLPFAMGVALIPALLVTLLEYLAAPRIQRRLPTLVPLSLAACGLFALHPGAFIAAALFALPMILSGWMEQPRAIVGDLLSLGIAAAVAVVALLPHLLGSLKSAAEATSDWPAVGTAAEAVGEAFLFGHASETVQVWFALLLLVGLITWLRLGSLRWIIVPAVLFVGLFVTAFASDAPLLEVLTRPWWNDSYRLIGIAAIPLALFVGHGVQQIHSTAVAATARLAPATEARQIGVIVRWSYAAVIVVMLLLLTGGSYLGRNEQLMSKNTGEGPALSSAEIEGLRVLGGMVRPGDRVMNDKGDGSVWMYALGGAVPVAGHYNQALVDPDVTLLSQRFDDYDTDPAVRAAAARLDVAWVVLGRGFLRESATRQPGLDDLGRVSELQLMYENPDFVIYRLNLPR